MFRNVNKIKSLHVSNMSSSWPRYVAHLVIVCSSPCFSSWSFLHFAVKFTCFRRYRRKVDQCSGIVVKLETETPDACCEELGQGFTKRDLVSCTCIWAAS